MIDLDLDGAVVCVTGGGRGIGRAIADALVRRGARVWIGELDADEVGRIAEQNGATATHLDVT